MSISETLREIREQVAEGKFPKYRRFAVTSVMDVFSPTDQRASCTSLPDNYKWAGRFDHPKD